MACTRVQDVYLQKFFHVFPQTGSRLVSQYFSGEMTSTGYRVYLMIKLLRNASSFAHELRLDPDASKHHPRQGPLFSWFWADRVMLMVPIPSPAVPKRRRSCSHLGGARKGHGTNYTGKGTPNSVKRNRWNMASRGRKEGAHR